MRPVPEKAKALIKEFESCKLRSYQDVAGVWTVGWGNTKHAKPKQSINQTTAEAWFEEDCNDVAIGIGKTLKPDVLAALDDDQYGALCSFAFNLGIRPKDHGIWALINKGPKEFGRVPSRMLLYNKAVVGGALVPVNGLTRRRRAEAAMWDTDGEKIVLTARAADTTPPPVLVKKKLPMSKRLWLGFTSATSGLSNWAIEHAQMAQDYAGKIQQLVAPQMTKSEFLAQLSSTLAVVAVASGVAIMFLQAQSHKDQKV